MDKINWKLITKLICFMGLLYQCSKITVDYLQYSTLISVELNNYINEN